MRANLSVIGELIDQVLQARNELGCNSYCFYRGQQFGNSLLPSLLRKALDDGDENNLYCDSWIMAGKEIAASRNSWEILAHFQHYGIPTRLLDWTSSLVNAIFFSITNCEMCKTKSDCTDNFINGICQGTPCVWILDSASMHKCFYDKEDKIKNNYSITIGIDDFPDYFESFVKWPKNDWPYKNGPIFIEVPWLSDRIKTQKGYFTFHPCKKDIDLMDESERNKFSRKVEISSKNIPALLEEIKVIGITEYDVYPDLSALGSYLKKKLG